MAEPGRHWDGAGLERKILAAGRPWTVGDIAMVADGQWAIGAQPEGRRVELTLEELARAVGSRIWDAHRDDDLA
ncbi:hypothetical protein OG285_05855 [Streptomyces sp. NBC_01471]|uniref:hypothetical protein n=1 Tax=Streptomyces sp. NBC_01471 TaxID=2903879 RepID=UPI003252D121